MDGRIVFFSYDLGGSSCSAVAVICVFRACVGEAEVVVSYY